MEQKITEYEKFIAEKTASDLTNSERAALAVYHQEMVANFQHERLIHLIIMFFFVAVTLIFLGIVGVSIFMVGAMLELIPLYLLAAILSILSIFYVKHYYFLENHIQGLYKYSKDLRLKYQEKK